jgi:hypothetical protein
MELQLVHSFVVGYVQERLSIHLQDLVADLKSAVTQVSLVNYFGPKIKQQESYI